MNNHIEKADEMSAFDNLSCIDGLISNDNKY